MMMAELGLASYMHDDAVPPAKVSETLGHIPTNELTYERFMHALEHAQEQGWISPVICATHDGIPHTEDEEDEWEQGFDPCAPVVRIWDQ